MGGRRDAPRDDGQAVERPARDAYSGASPFRSAERAPLLQRAVPVTRDLRAYRTRTARSDLAAGLTVAALAVPSGMAYAEVAGLQATAGLYALLLPTLAYALLGSSRQLIVGPEGSLSALVAVSVLAVASAGSARAGELAATLALLVAACFLLARAARVGWVADYLSRPVLVGYLHGVVVVLLVGQLGKLLGLNVEALDPIPQLVEVAREIGQTSGATLAVGAAALAVLVPLRFVAPRVPAALLVVVGAIVVSDALDLAAHGVAVVGAIPAGLPDLRVPRPGLADTLDLLPAAVGLFLVCFADEVLTARSFAGRRGQHVRVGQELLAMGAANAAAGVTQAFPVGASGSRTAVNDAMGARSQIAALLAAGTIALVLLFLTGPIADLPKAVLAAVIVNACIGLVDVPAWRELGMTDRVELAIAAVTAAGVVLVGVLEAIVFAVGLSIVDVARRSARPHDAVLGWSDRLGRWADVSVHRSARVTPGVVVYRLDDRLFFANATYVKARVQEALLGAPSDTRWLVFDAEAVTHVDTAGLDAIAELAASLHHDGVILLVAEMKDHVRARLAEAGTADRVGEDRFYPTVSAAIDSTRRHGPRPAAR
jgi:high affinity sulfate transporter 1